MSSQDALAAAHASRNAGDLDGHLRLYDETIRLHGYSPQPMDKDAVRGFYEAIFAAFDGPQLEVVAEGVEDQSALDLLADAGCDFAQGYHFSRPLPADEFAAWARGRATSSAVPAG